MSPAGYSTTAVSPDTFVPGTHRSPPTEDTTALDRDPAKLPTMPPSAPPLPEAVPLRTGYLKEELIGQGAYGQVWRGRSVADHRTVAIKVLKEEFAAKPEVVARFVREGVSLRSIRHPHLVPVYDLVAEGTMLAIVMELVPGENLRATLARGALDHGTAVTLLGQVAQALAAVHAANIVHRDVKPENVLVTSRGGGLWARLTDFGVAHVADGQLLTKQTVVGTYAYLAPELAQGRTPTPAADVYALGVMAYELLAGRRPFTHDNSAALLHAHLNDLPVRPPEVGDDLWPVIEACLVKLPDRRPSANTLAKLFGGAHGLPTDAPPPLPSLPPTSFPPSAKASVVLPPALSVARPPSEVPAAGPLSEVPSGIAAGHVPSGLPASGAPAELLSTSGPTAAIPDPPAEPPARRRRPWLVAGLATLLLASTGAGLWLGLPETQQTAPTPRPSSRVYTIPVTLTSPARGRIRIDFEDASSEPGFRAYQITGTQKAVLLVAGEAPPYDVRNLDPRTRHCYKVQVIVVSDQPLPADAKPACRAADGRDAPDKP